MYNLPYLVGNALTLTLAYVTSSASVERYFVEKSCDAVTVNATDNRNYMVFWNCVFLPAFTDYCRIIFKNPGHNHQTCVNAKQLNFNINSQLIEIISGNSSLPYEILTNSSIRYDVQQCVHNQDMIIIMKWDTICNIHAAGELLITTEATYNAEDKGKALNQMSKMIHDILTPPDFVAGVACEAEDACSYGAPDLTSTGSRWKLILGMFILSIPFSFMVGITIYGQYMRYRRAVQLQVAVD